MVLKKWQKIALFTLPILIGGVIIWMQLKKKGKPSPGSLHDTQPYQPTKSLTVSGGSGSSGVSYSAYPLKKGSTDKNTGGLVSQLQTVIGSDNLPNYGIDGDFGSETESALYSLYGKKQIDSPSDFEKFKNQMSGSNQSLTQYEQASKLYYEWTDGDGNIIPTADTSATQITFNSNGEYVNTGVVVPIYKGVVYNRNDFKISAVATTGELRVTVSSTGDYSDFAGDYLVNPWDLIVA